MKMPSNFLCRIVIGNKIYIFSAISEDLNLTIFPGEHTPGPRSIHLGNAVLGNLKIKYENKKNKCVFWDLKCVLHFSAS